METLPDKPREIKKFIDGLEIPFVFKKFFNTFTKTITSKENLQRLIENIIRKYVIPRVNKDINTLKKQQRNLVADVYQITQKFDTLNKQVQLLKQRNGKQTVQRLTALEEQVQSLTQEIKKN